MNKREFCLSTLFVLGLALCLTQAKANETTSRNIVGYVKITIPPRGQYNLICWNFQNMGGGPITLKELFGERQLTKDRLPTRADKIALWKPADKLYEIYFQSNVDGGFRSARDPFGPPVHPLIQPGEGFWIGSPQLAGEPREIYLIGEVNPSVQGTQSLVRGMNLLNSPYATTQRIQNNDWLADGATPGSILPLADTVVI